MPAVGRMLQLDNSQQHRQLMGTLKREDTIESSSSNRSSARQDRRQSRQVPTHNINLIGPTIPEESTKPRNDDDFIAWLMGNRQTPQKTNISTPIVNQKSMATEVQPKLEPITSVVQSANDKNVKNDKVIVTSKLQSSNAVDNRSTDKSSSRKSSSRKISTEGDHDVVIGSDARARNRSRKSTSTASAANIHAVEKPHGSI